MSNIIFEKTKFGQITISGTKYKKDVYLFTDGTIQKRDKSRSLRIGGHKELAKVEIEGLLKGDPEVLFIGMGQSGVLPIREETNAWLDKVSRERNIKVIQNTTPNLLQKVNDFLNQGKSVAGIFHTTC